MNLYTPLTLNSEGGYNLSKRFQEVGGVLICGGIAGVGMSNRFEIFLYFSTLKLRFFPFLDLKI